MVANQRTLEHPTYPQTSSARYSMCQLACKLSDNYWQLSVYINSVGLFPKFRISCQATSFFFLSIKQLLFKIILLLKYQNIKILNLKIFLVKYKTSLYRLKNENVTYTGINVNVKGIVLVFIIGPV